MRVIAGTARRLLLKTPEGEGTRPTTDRIKETLFNMIHFDLPGSYFLDLFAGSGGIGIEALSRGAEKAVFVENNQKTAAIIRENLRTTGLADRGLVLARDYTSALAMLGRNGESFDFIFIDPPYGKGLEDDALYIVSKTQLLKTDGLIIVESDLDKDFDDLSGWGLTVEKEKKYKTNKHTFIRHF